MSSRRALRSTVDADLNSPLKSEPRKRSARKKTPAVNDALASSVEAALEGQTPPSIQSEAESEMQATAESRSTSPITTSQQPMRRRLRSASRELSPADMQSTAPSKVTKGRNARTTSSTTKQRASQPSARGGSSRGRGRGKKAAPSSRNNSKNLKRPAGEISDQSADETENDNMSRASKRARSDQYSGDDDRTSVASTEADEHDSSTYHTPQAERALQPFSPIVEVDEPETPMGAARSTSRSNEQQQFLAQSSRESITMTAREGSLEIIEHTQEVNVRQNSMEVMQSTETNEDVTQYAEDMGMSDAEAHSDSSDLADSPSAQLVPQSAQNEQQEADNSEEEDTSEPESSGVTTTTVAGPSASAANDQITSPKVVSVAQAQPNTPITPKADSSSFFSKFNFFRSAQKPAQPEVTRPAPTPSAPTPSIPTQPEHSQQERAQSEGAQEPVLNSLTRVGVRAVTPPRPSSPTISRAPATVSSSSAYYYLEARGIGPGMYNKRLAAYRPGQPSQPVQQEAEDEEDSEDEFTRQWEASQEAGYKPRPISLNLDMTVRKKNHKLEMEMISMKKKDKQKDKQNSRTIKQLKDEAEQMKQRMTLMSKQMFFPATSTRPEKILTDPAEIEEAREVFENHFSRKAEQQIGSASMANNTQMLAEKTGPASIPHDTTAAVFTIDTVTNPPLLHPAPNSPADVPAISSTVNLNEGGQQCNTGAPPIDSSLVNDNMDVDDGVDVAQPVTPTPATEPSKKGYWSAATGKIRNLVTPFIFGRGQTAADAASANDTEVDTPKFTYEQPMDLGDTPTKPHNKRRPRKPRQQATTSHQKRPEPQPISKSHTPSKNASASRFGRKNQVFEKLLTLEEAEAAEKARLAKVREKLDNMTPEEKAAREQKALEIEKRMRDHKAKHEAAMANSRKRGSQSAFGDDDETPSRSPSKKVLIKKNHGEYKFPSLDEEQALNALVDEEEEAAAAAKAKSLDKGKSPMRHMSTTPLSSRGSPMNIDSPTAVLSQDLPAELQHPLDRAPDALYLRIVELVQALMTDEERLEDENMRVRDFNCWKIVNAVYGRMTVEEDLEIWESHCTSVRKVWGANGTEAGLQSQKEGFLREQRAEREARQIEDIERRKKRLFARDPNNVFLKAQQQEEAQIVDHEEVNVSGTFRVPDTIFDDDDDDEEEDESNTAATNTQQSVDDQAANTPPPPPRPGNAQLPQQGAGVYGLSNYLKHVPTVPSKLRHVEKMSPLQIKEKERRESTGVQDKENKPPGPLEQSFRNWAAPYMKDGVPVPGGWQEEYDYGEEDIEMDLKEAYEEMQQQMQQGMQMQMPF